MQANRTAHSLVNVASQCLETLSGTTILYRQRNLLVLVIDGPSKRATRAGLVRWLPFLLRGDHAS